MRFSVLKPESTRQLSLARLCPSLCDGESRTKATFTPDRRPPIAAFRAAKSTPRGHASIRHTAGDTGQPPTALLSVSRCRQNPRRAARRQRRVRSDAFAPRNGGRLDGLTACPSLPKVEALLQGRPGPIPPRIPHSGDYTRLRFCVIKVISGAVVQVGDGTAKGPVAGGCHSLPHEARETQAKEQGHDATDDDANARPRTCRLRPGRQTPENP